MGKMKETTKETEKMPPRREEENHRGLGASKLSEYMF